MHDSRNSLRNKITDLRISSKSTSNKKVIKKIKEDGNSSTKVYSTLSLLNSTQCQTIFETLSCGRIISSDLIENENKIISEVRIHLRIKTP